MAGLLVVGALAGCATVRSDGSIPTANLPQLVFRNLTGTNVGVYLDGGGYRVSMGTVPAHGIASLRVPAAVMRSGVELRLAVVSASRAPHHTPEVIDLIAIAIEELGTKEWTLRGAILVESPVRGAPLAGGRDHR